MEHVLRLCLLICTSLRVGFGAEAFLDEPPAHVVAIQGDTILLRCGVDRHIAATLSWKDIDTSRLLTKGSLVDPERNFQQSTRSRISIIGDRKNGEYHLQIRDVVGEDGGRYACYYFDSTTLTDHHSTVVTLTVMTPPADGYPKCSMEPLFTRIGVGDNITLVCESRGGNPPAALTWIRKREIVDVQYTPGNAKPVNRYPLILTEDDTDVRYVCLARNPATKQPASCTIKPLRTKIAVQIEPSTLQAVPGTTAVFNCFSEVIPGIVFTWYVNDRKVDGSHRRFILKRKGMRLKINPVIPSDDYSLITCIVEQPIVNYDLSGTATSVLWVNRDSNPNFVWETTTAPPLPTTMVEAFGIGKTTKGATTASATSPEITTKPIGIHGGAAAYPSGELQISFDINDLLETLITPELVDPVIPEREVTLQPLNTHYIPKTTETTSTTATTTVSLTTTVMTTSEPGANNELCRGENCISAATESLKTAKASQISLDPDPSNELAEMVTPPRERATRYRGLNDIPISSEQKSSNGTAIGLSLGLIFLTAIVLVIAFVIWRSRSQKQKDEDKEKQKLDKEKQKPAKKSTK